jgi:peptidoglycan/LPS O-acetylase OafA/YrhL
MTERSASTPRIRYIDGLRGVAIGLVLLFHAWQQQTLGGGRPGAARTAFNFVASRGYEGVSLFLVLSGFCLSVPLWTRYRSGVRAWFIPSHFFARRCLRILPPYYVALILSMIASALIFHSGSSSLQFREHSVIGKPLDTANILFHGLLIHNLTAFTQSINAPFWTLGLEWQWYFVFPIVLLMCTRSRVKTLAIVLVVGVVWVMAMRQLETGALMHIWNHIAVSKDTTILPAIWEQAVPGRLFEFCCGLVAAYLVVTRRSPSAPWLVAAFVASVTAAHVLHASANEFGLFQPLYGIAFGALVLLGDRSQIFNRVLSWRPLVGLGVVSYSVYLVHSPIIAAAWDPATRVLHTSFLTLPAVIGIGILAGIIFHLVVERPCMERKTWDRVGPTLTSAFRWTDALWGTIAEDRLHGRPKTEEPRVLPTPAEGISG